MLFLFRGLLTLFSSFASFAKLWLSLIDQLIAVHSEKKTNSGRMLQFPLLFCGLMNPSLLEGDTRAPLPLLFGFLLPGSQGGERATPATAAAASPPPGGFLKGQAHRARGRDTLGMVFPKYLNFAAILDCKMGLAKIL